MSNDYRKEQDRVFQTMKDAEQRDQEQQTRQGLIALGWKPENIEGVRAALWAGAGLWAGATTEGQKHVYAEQGLARMLKLELAEFEGRVN